MMELYGDGFFPCRPASTMPPEESVNLSAPKEDLEDLQRRKALVEAQIEAMERQIFGLESSYLEETSLYGNVIRGFDGYLQNRTAMSQSERKRFRFHDSDRLFSMSSSTYSKALEGEDVDDEENPSSPGAVKTHKRRKGEDGAAAALMRKNRRNKDSDDYVDV